MNFSICLFYYENPIYLICSFFIQLLLSHHAKKNNSNLKKKNFLVFFKTIVGTFYATCAVTGYPCFIVASLSIELKLLNKGVSRTILKNSSKLPKKNLLVQIVKLHSKIITYLKELSMLKNVNVKKILKTFS